MKKSDPRLDLHSPEQIALLDDVLTWNGLAARSGFDANLLAQWYRRRKLIGGTHYSLFDLAGRTDHSPPLFLGSVVLPVLKAERRVRR